MNYSSEMWYDIERDYRIGAFVNSGMSVGDAVAEVNRIEAEVASEVFSEVFFDLISWPFVVIEWFSRGLVRVAGWVTAALWRTANRLANRLVTRIAADRQNKVRARRHVSSHITRHGIHVTTAAARLLDVAAWLIPLEHRARWAEELAGELIEISRTHSCKFRHVTYAIRVLATMPSFRRALKAGSSHVDTPAQR